MAAIRAVTGKTRLEIRLIPVPQAMEIARVFVRHKLIRLGRGESVDDACQIVSEMISNAATATGDPRTQGSIRLHIIQSLAVKFGWRKDAERGEKAVWAPLR